MGFLDRLLGKSAPSSGPLAFLLGLGSPVTKSREALRSYTSWVYACTSAIADEIATIEFRLQKKSGDTWTDIPSHPAIDLLNRVNPIMTSDELFGGTASYLDLEGNAFWYVAYNRKSEPVEFWPLRPDQVEVKDGKDFLIDAYVYTNDAGKQIPFKPKEIIHFKRFNPLNRLRGIGTVAAAALAIDTDLYAGQWNRNFFNNSALPAAVLQTDAKLTDEQFGRIKASWESKYKGVENAHRTAILEGGLKVEKLNLSQKEMDFLEQRRFGRDEIMAMFRMPKTVLGITDDVNRANAEATDYVYAKRVISPRMRFIATTLTEFYLPMWGLPTSEYRLWNRDPVPQNKEADLAYKQMALNTGYRTRNEIREQEGFKPLDDGDILLVPGTLKPIDQILNPPEPPAMAPGGKPAALPKKAVQKAAEDATALRTQFLVQRIKDGAKEIDDFFTKQRKAVEVALNAENKTVKADGHPDLTIAVLRAFDDWVSVLRPIVEGIDKDTYQYAGERTIAEAGLDISFDLLNPRALNWVRDHGLAMATEINDTMKEEIRSRIAAGVEAGKGSKDIAGDIRSFFDDQSEWRAMRIARTETINAYGQGSLEAARQAGMEEKSWITAGDARVEPECADNERAGWIPRESSFPSGHIAPVVHQNCRCSVAFREKQNV